LELTHYEELFDYDIVNFIGLQRSPSWSVDPSRMIDIQLGHYDMLQSSKEFEAVVRHTEQTFSV
jgi:hypothetical protein